MGPKYSCTSSTWVPTISWLSTSVSTKLMNKAKKAQERGLMCVHARSLSQKYRGDELTF
jgi:hypothetical protein